MLQGRRTGDAALTSATILTVANYTTELLQVEQNGNVLIGTATDGGYRLDIDAGAMRYAEMTAPSAPAANSVVLYAADNGGKTTLYALFNTGAAQVVAAEP